MTAARRYFALRNVLLLGCSTVSVFLPSDLFASGEQGAWYDPSDLSTMFQDAAGTTPVTAVEQPVGLLLDKSKGLALGSQLVTDGSFSVGTVPAGWSAVGSATLGVTSGELVVTTSVGTGFPGADLALTTIVGTWYRVRLTARKTASNNCSVYIADAGGNYITSTANIGATNTSYEIYFLARYTSTTVKIFEFIGGAGTGTIIVDNVSATSVAGNHASQSTAASRPVLSARVNQLTFSEQFDNAAWTKATSGGVTVTANATTAPDGASTADLIVPNAALGNHLIRQAGSTVGGPCTFSVYYKPFGYTKIGIREDFAVGQFASFNCSGAGSVLNNTGGTTATISSLANGWYLLTFRNTSTAANQGVAFYILDDGYTTGDPPGYTYTGNGTSGGYLWGADLRVTNVGVNLPAYQRVAAATDYDTSGFPLYLKFDGVDDSLATGTIDPGAVDKAQAFAGVRKLSDAAGAVLVEHSAAVLTNAGAFAVFAPSSAAPNYLFRSRGSAGQVNADYTNALVAAPISSVLTGIGDISGDVVRLRVNGSQVAETLTDQGTGNYLSYPLYIGRRGATSNPYNGNLYSLVVRFSAANLSDAQIASTETYVNNLTKAY